MILVSPFAKVEWQISVQALHVTSYRLLRIQDYCVTKIKTMMNPNYNLTQQKIYTDYSVKSNGQLLDVLSNANRYNQEVVEIVSDILYERNKLPGRPNENYDQSSVNNENTYDHLLDVEAKKEAFNNMVYGGLIGGAGIFITIVSYMAASGGGVYVIATGAIIGGIIRFFKGASVYFD